jgi:hypothetical protein
VSDTSAIRNGFRLAGIETGKVIAFRPRAAAQPRVRRLRETVVYFVQAVPDGPIKIGSSREIAERMATLRTCSPLPLELLATQECRGYRGRRTERELHRRFAAHRLHGEWFRPHEEILDYIRSIPRQGFIEE